jgi:hypothetical protein
MSRIRVLLDASVVRSAIHGDEAARPLAGLDPARHGLSLAIARNAVAELTQALLEGRLPWDAWGRRIPEVDRLIERESPISPDEAEWLSIGCTWDPPRLPVSRAEHMRAIWSVLSGARASADLAAGTTLVGEGGFVWPVAVSPAMSASTVTEQRDPWRGIIASLQRSVAGIRENDPTLPLPTEGMTASSFIDAKRAERPDDPAWALRHDGHLRAVARFFYLAALPRASYNAESEDRQGDAFDLEMLMALAIPALVCTLDGKLIKHVALTKSVQAGQVLTPAELLAGAEGRDLIERFPPALRQIADAGRGE